MLSLSTIAVLLGVLMLVLCVPGLVRPELQRKLLLAFPRNVMASRILAAIAVFWVSWIVFHGNLGRFAVLQPMVYLAGPLLLVVLLLYLDELLAPRALGFLLLLAANPILVAARWHESNWSILMSLIAYIMVIKGIILVLSPFRFRLALNFWADKESRYRLMNFLGVGMGVLVVILGISVY